MVPDPADKLLGIEFDDAERRPEDDRSDAEPLEQYVRFTLGKTEFALPVEVVRTIAAVPDETTRVPSSPDAVVGLVDRRGEITAVVDPCVHFPSVDRHHRPRRERLLVLDRPTDRQSSALWVDDVDGVETIPESDVVESVEDGEISGAALEHPLVASLLVQEREEDGPGAVQAQHRAEGGTATGGESTLGASDDDLGTPFELEDRSANGGDEGVTRTVVVEVTPVLDVERVLLASGTVESGT